MRSTIIAILLGSAVTLYGQRAGTVLPVHSLHTGFFATTNYAYAGFFVEYQYYVDDLWSYVLRPGMSFYTYNGEIGNDVTKTDAKNYFIYGGINYRFSALRNPLRKRPVNSQPYLGFYPVTFEYIKITYYDSQRDRYNTGSRFGLVPSGVIGYTIVFLNRFDLDMHVGLGASFRISGKEGSAIEPVLFSGIGLGVRL